MSDKKITEFTTITEADDAADLLNLVDVTDTSYGVGGTNKKISLANFFKNLPTFLGIGIVADATVRFAVKTSSALFEYLTDDVVVRLNKAATADVASHQFQTNSSGRADVGLIDNDDYTIKTSPDGSAWTDALIASKTDGSINVPVGLKVGSGSLVKKVLSATATLDFPSISAQSNQDLTITVTGAAVGDSVFLGLPAAPLVGVAFNAFVSATDTVTVRAVNYTGTSKDPASATYRATVFNYS